MSAQSQKDHTAAIIDTSPDFVLDVVGEKIAAVEVLEREIPSA